MHRTGLFIMGGSTYYTLLLLESLKCNGVLCGLSRITLFGRNRERLSLIANSGYRLMDGQIDIDFTDRIEDCLSEDYGLIFNQIRFGGMSTRDRDEKTAIRVGLPADETIGIVGVSNAVRSIQGMKPYLQVIQRKPGPYTLVNFTNPCSIMVQYISQYYSIPVVGVCDYPQMMRREIARALAIDLEALDIGYFGLNHFGFIYSVTRGRDDLLAQVMQKNLPFKPDSNAFFSYLLNVSWRFVLERQQVVEQQRASANRASQLLQIEAELDGLAAEGAVDPQRYLAILRKRNCDWFDLVVSPLFDNLLKQTGSRQILNMPVADVFDIGLEGTVVEGTCRPGAPYPKIELPPPQVRHSEEFALVRLLKKAEQLLLQGILANDGKLIIRACLVNPMVQQLDKTLAYFSALARQDEVFSELFP